MDFLGGKTGFFFSGRSKDKEKKTKKNKKQKKQKQIK